VGRELVVHQLCSSFSVVHFAVGLYIGTKTLHNWNISRASVVHFRTSPETHIEGPPDATPLGLFGGPGGGYLPGPLATKALET